MAPAMSKTTIPAKTQPALLRNRFMIHLRGPRGLIESLLTGEETRSTVIP
jgi:hypothetical protein